ncbi:MAG TPA: hypothetical protein VFS43_08505 [Polyangiaceae bacterium]|nr:hypothetical protein [Polyangiaceae bacterium]
MAQGQHSTAAAAPGPAFSLPVDGAISPAAMGFAVDVVSVLALPRPDA